jgi:epoxyqueuosine reductase
MKNNFTVAAGKIKHEAHNMGFTACGIAPACLLEDDARRLKDWLSKGLHAGMQYMENHFEKRIDPHQLVPGGKSVIVVLLNYYPSIAKAEDDNLIISKYAYGQDYHQVMKAKLKTFQKVINKDIIPCKSRAFVDSAPVMERTWAARAGLGWIGKNSNLISPQHGSFVFIGEIIVNSELEYDKPIHDYCGQCNKCIEACPTGAIISPRKIDSNRCISYWTIEHKGSIPKNLKGKFNNRIFGCDICQDICPRNHRVKPNNVSEFTPTSDLINMCRNDWQNLTEEKYNELFAKSAVKRVKYSGLKRNIEFVTYSNSQ